MINKKEEVTVNAWIKTYEDKKGLRQIVVVVTQNGKHTFQKTPWKVKLSDWTGIKNAWVGKKHPNFTKINNDLTKRVNEFESQYKELEDKQGYVTKDDVINKVNSVFMKQDFLAYWDKVVEGFENYNQEKGYTTTRGKIVDFIKGDKIDFKSINDKWLSKFEEYLKGNDLAEESIGTQQKRIRRIWNIAIGAKVIDREFYPFGKDGYKIKQTNTYSKKIQRLSVEEITAVFNLQYEKYTNIWFVQKGFELAFNLAGIRIEDLLTLKHNNCTNGEIKYNMKKGVTQSKLMVFEIDTEIRRILNELNTSESKPNDYLLPFLKPGIQQQDSRTYKKEVGRKTALYNKYLKQIADDAGVSKNLTSHIARHSFASITYETTKDYRLVQQNLGHKNVLTTMGYVGVLSTHENSERLKAAKAGIYNRK